MVRERLLTWLLVAAVVAALLSTVAGISEARAEPAIRTVPAAVGTGGAGLTECLASNDQLLVLYLVDESASLRDTDPQDQRVAAVESTLALLARLPEAAGTDLEIAVSIATFGEVYTTRADWDTLTPQTLSTFQTAARTLAEQDTAIDTDYYVGLEGANQAIAQESAARTQAAQPAPCKLVLWFTDGEYSIDERGTITKPYGTGTAAELERLGMELVCQPGGVSDDLRRSQVHLNAIALTTDLAAADQSAVQAIALGSAGGQTCGTVPIPPTWASGAYTPVENADSLLVDIAQGLICARGSCTEAGAPRDLRVCPGEACPAGTGEFPVDPGVVGFDVLAVAEEPGFGLTLRGPGDTGSLSLTNDEDARDQQHSGATVSAVWMSGASVLVTGVVADSQAVGTWRASLVDPEGGTRPPASMHVYVFGGLEPSIPEVPTLQAGETTDVTVQVVGPDGAPADLSVFRDTSVTGELVDPVTGGRTSMEFAADGASTYTASLETPPDLESSTARLVVAVDAVTSSGLSLEPVSRTVPVDVRPPLVYPQVSPAALAMTPVEGIEASTGSIELTSGQASGGCVWVAEAAFPDAPQSAGVIDVSTSPLSSQQDCVRVEAGESAQIDVSALPSGEANGSAQGSVSLRLASDAESDVRTLVVPASFEMAKPLSAATAGLTALLLMLLAALVPLFVMWLLNFLSRGYSGLSTIQYARVEVALTGDPSGVHSGLVRRSPARSRPGVPETVPTDLVVPDDFQYLHGSDKRVPKLAVEGLELTSHAPFHKPFQAPENRVASSAGGVTLTGGGRTGGGRTGEKGGRSWAAIDPALNRVWVLVVHDSQLNAFVDRGAGSGAQQTASPAWSQSPFGAQRDSAPGALSATSTVGEATGELYVFAPVQVAGDPGELQSLIADLDSWAYAEDLVRVAQSRRSARESAGSRPTRRPKRDKEESEVEPPATETPPPFGFTDPPFGSDNDDNPPRSHPFLG